MTMVQCVIVILLHSGAIVTSDWILVAECYDWEAGKMSMDNKQRIRHCQRAIKRVHGIWWYTRLHHYVRGIIPYVI